MILSCCLLAILASPATADTVHLKGGRTIHARQCRAHGGELRCSHAGGVIGVPLDQVVRVETDDSLPSRRPESSGPAARPGSQPVPPLPLAPTAEPLTPQAALTRIDELTPLLSGKDGGGTAARRELSLLHAYLGNVAMLAHDYDGAVGHYRIALDHDQSQPVARLNLGSALINLNRHEEAEELLRQLLLEQPDSARGLDLLGEAALRRGRIGEAIELWERSLAISSSDPLRAKLERARRLNRAEEGFQRSDAAHFSLKFDAEEASGELAQEIISYLETSLADLAGRFDHHQVGVIQVILYSQRAFQEATSSPDWVGGLFDGQIRLPVGGLSRLTPQVRRVLMHELTHCVINERSRGNAPQWVQEGIAQVMEGKSAASSRAALRQAYDALGGPAGAREFSYRSALSQMEFFLEAWSESHFNDLLDHLGRGTDIDASLRAVTGLSYGEFLKAWGDSLEG